MHLELSLTTLYLRFEMQNELEAFTKIWDVEWTRGFH